MFSGPTNAACVTDVILFLNRGFNFIQHSKGIIHYLMTWICQTHGLFLYHSRRTTTRLSLACSRRSKLGKFNA